MAGPSQTLTLSAKLYSKVGLASPIGHKQLPEASRNTSQTEHVQTAITHEPPRSLSASIAPAPSPIDEVQQEIFRLANQVALHYAETHHWSSFHAWNSVHQAKSQAQDIETATFWDNIRPFGSCLGISTHIYHALKSALSTHPNPMVAAHSATVKLMTSAQYATSEPSYHAIVGLCFDNYALVIDHSLHPTAFQVPLGGEYVMHAYILLFSDRSQERFRYFLDESGKYLLTIDSAIVSYQPSSMTDMDVDATVAQLAIPAASQVKLLKGTSDIYLPPRKYVSVRAFLDEEPRFIPFVHMHGKFPVTALRVQVSFEDATLLVQIPRADPLDKKQGRSWASRLTRFDQYVEKCEATVQVSVQLRARTCSVPSEHEQSQLTMLAVLVEEFGLEGKLVIDMANSIFRVWTR